MKRTISFILMLMMLCSVLQVAAANQTALYVSPQGNDSNPGTLAQPLATLNKACEMAEQADGAVINVMGGTYQVDKAVSLGKNASNTVIRAYKNEKPVFTASHSLDGTAFKKVTDQAILDRIVDKKAKDQVVCIDMKQAGITDLGKLYMNGFGYPAVPEAPQLLVNGIMQTLARYPDDDYMTISKVVDPGVNVRNNTEGKTVMDYQGNGISIRTSDARVSKWAQAKDVFMFGYFMVEWAEAVLPCTIDFEDSNTISTEYPSVYGVTENRRFYCFNLLEEISKPGEWYLDRETGMLYVYPEKALNSEATVEFITFGDPFITIDGAENVTVQGLELCKGLGQGIVVKNSKKISVEDCLFHDISSTVIDIYASYDCGVSYCKFENIGSQGISLSAGDRTTLTPGNSYVSNCVFKDFQRIKPTSSPAIWLKGVGNTASHNEISGGKNIAIWFNGNDHIIEYNDISDVCTDTADAGAIYAGRDWTARGNEIRYNYIHDMKIIDSLTGMKVQAIYLDDMFSSAKVHGNIISKVPSVALYGGGRYNTFENNIVLSCSEPFVFDARGLGWAAASTQKGGDMMNNLTAVPYTSDVWSKAYPELVNILEDEPALPKYNIIKNNVSYRTPDYNLDENVTKYGTVENNITISKTDVFEDFKNGDLTLKADSEIFKKIPDFEPIDFKAIGVQEKPVKVEKTLDDVLSDSVVLKLNNSKTLIFGSAGSVDPQNEAVVPVVQNDRTLVPVRFIAESFGGEVTWDEATQKVGVTCGDAVIELTIDKAELTLNGQTIALDVPATVIQDRTMLPLRAVVESLGKTVFWNEGGGLIVISNEPVLEETETDLIQGVLSQF